MADWLRTSCTECGGRGVVMVYGGYDCHGADLCEVCDGSGSIWVSNKDRLAVYPGGRLLGMAPGLYEEEKARTAKVE